MCCCREMGVPNKALHATVICLAQLRFALLQHKKHANDHPALAGLLAQEA